MPEPATHPRRRPQTAYTGVSGVLLVALLLPASTAAADAAAGDKAVAAARDHLAQHRRALGLAAADLDELAVGDRYVSRHTGTTHVYLRQRLHGIEVYNAVASVALARDGRVSHLAERLVRNLARRANGAVPELPATAAVERAARALGLASPTDLRILTPARGRDRRTTLSGGGVSRRDIPARLVYQPLADGRLRLAWDLLIEPLAQDPWWSVRIDAGSGRMLDHNDLVANEQYLVYPLPVESPGDATPAPPADARQVVVDPFASSPASPFGWHATGGGITGLKYTITRGNNVHAYADRNADDIPDGGADAEPDGGAALDFTGPLVAMDLTQDPGTYTQAAIANLFYWNNVVHDVAWLYGFDEPAGNFQVENHGLGGAGGDDVLAEAQDGGICNANFATPADGDRPRMQMFTCDNTSPARDGAFDHGVIVHEYAHGISNRLTGGPSTAGCLANAEQMGEGWSDYLALMLTMEPGDQSGDGRGIATYLFGQPADGPGIRPAPYSTDFGINAFTYGDLPGLSIPHGVGFAWATALWDMTWELIARHGFNADVYGDWTTGGNNLALQLVMDGMKLQPCAPGFVDGRDAVLAADDLLTGDGSLFSGANQCALWRAFAGRGLGAGADQGSVTDVSDGSEAFDRPPGCETLGTVESARNVCQGETASYRIGVGEQFGTPPVTLAVTGAPTGTTTSFSANPVAAVPGISDLTVADTAAAAPGAYVLTITGSDGTATVFDTTVGLRVFAEPPAAGPALVAPADGAADQPLAPTFAWTALAEAVTYTFELDDDPAFGSIDYSASGLTAPSHAPAIGLAWLTSYFWRVRGENSCGAGVDSAVFRFTTRVFPGDCPPGFAGQVAFEDDFETGAPGWTSGGIADTWALSGARVTSGGNAFHAVDSPNRSDQRLVSPPIAVPVSGDAVTLQFQSFQIFEPPNSDGRCWDAGILEISTDDGLSWSQVPQGLLLANPYDNVLWNDVPQNAPSNNPIAVDYGATLAWCDELEPFERVAVDVGGWAGQTVRFGWRLGSDSLVGDEGWYVDDVRVQSCPAAGLFSDGFESGDVTAWSASAP